MLLLINIGFMCPSQDQYFWYIHKNFLKVSIPFYGLNTEDNPISRELKSILNSELTTKVKKIHETLKHVLLKKIGGMNYFFLKYNFK